MIKHLFKLMWNRKRTNFLIILEIFFSFFVLFVVMTIGLYHLLNYLKPLGFEYENVWAVSMNWKNQDTESVKETLAQLENNLDSYPEIEAHSFSYSYLFMPAAMSTSDFEYQDRKALCLLLSGGDTYPDVLGIKIEKGRWFDAQDNAATREPVILNKVAVETFFDDEDPIGKVFKRDGTECEVIGTIGEFRKSGELSGSDEVVITRISLANEEASKRLLDSESFARILLQVKPGTDIYFEEELTQQLTRITGDWNIRIKPMTELRHSAHRQSLILPTILAIICGFLIINVALGLFGVIWYSINRRRPEIGLRRSLGGTSRLIYKQILGEVWVLVTFGIIIGSFFALQFPILNFISFIDTHVYYLAFGSSLVLIYLIATICAIYPSFLASAIHPAQALHYE